jgi:hypothetical protein
MEANPSRKALMNFGSRKFILTLLIQIVGAYGFIVGRMDGGTYVALSTLVLGVYGGASVLDKKLNPDQQ